MKTFVKTLGKKTSRIAAPQAVMDIGSNAVRMLVGELGADGVFIRHLFTRAPIGLGLQSYGGGGISAAALRKLILAAQGMQKIAEAMEARRLCAVATAAVRDCDSKNRRRMLNALRREVELEVNVLTGAQEAELIGVFAAAQFPKAKHVLSADCGGGSADCALITNGDLSARQTFGVGAARKNGGATAEKNRMTRWLKRHCPPGATVIAGGGGARKLSQLCGVLTERKIAQFIADSRSLSAAQLSAQLQLTPDRAHNIVPAAKIFLRILRACNCPAMRIMQGGLGEAVLTRLLRGEDLPS